MNTVLTETLSSGGLPVRASHNERSGIVESLYRTGSPVGSIWLRDVRLGLSVVLCWIGGLLYERSVCRQERVFWQERSRNRGSLSSAPTMIPCIDSISGWATCACWR